MRASGTVVTKTEVIPANGILVVEWTSPRTLKRTWARYLSLKATAAVTVSTDDGPDTYPVPAAPASGEQPFETEGVINRLTVVGAAGTSVRTAATIAA